MRVAILPADTGCTGHMRLIWPADAVRKIRPGWDVKVFDPRMVKVERLPRGGIRVHGMNPDEIDVLVTQRVGSPTVAALCGWLQERGVAVVLDMDDAMWCLDRKNVAYQAWNQPLRNARGIHWSVCDEVAGGADLVTVTTDALAARYGGHGRVQVLPNRVPRMALTARTREPTVGVPVAGWAGFLSTHPRDPQAVGDGVRRAVEAGHVSAAVIGDAYQVGKLWGVKTAAYPGVSLGMPYFQQLTKLDIGLVPLDLEGSSAVFNTSKSSLKALEMSATGSAVVASPSPANVAFAEQVPIRLAATPDEWAQHLAELSDPVVRGEQVEKQTAALEANRWVLQDRAVDWVQAWETAVDNRRNDV